MNVIIPSILRKNIQFRRLPTKACSYYEVYAEYKDANSSSGKRLELLDKFQNPIEPSLVLRRITLSPEKEPTWRLPEDIFMDRTHKFRIFLNGFALPSLYYNYNRVTKLVSIDTSLQAYVPSDTVELEYYLDVITRSYAMEENCRIIIRPVFSQDYGYGDHNVIM